MAALRAELLAGQQQLLAEQSRVQERLSKLERDVALLGLADGAYLQLAEETAVQQQLEVEAELAQQEAAVQLERQLGTAAWLEGEAALEAAADAENGLLQ